MEISKYKNMPLLGVASFAASKLKASVLACIAPLSPFGGGAGGGFFHFQFSVFS